eukprot:TRINITY_DN2884_c0_g1_i1.p1 TRINITY_DN2884_c0_g1~~TRINITY_DN2884_c0_g1_i1.p1  ORF type:complete len:141 (+),score=15.13 TRINITY_DN2884_c0_g1_i1:15-437(+)
MASEPKKDTATSPEKTPDEQAAVVMQSAWRGRQVRKSMTPKSETKRLDTTASASTTTNSSTPSTTPSTTTTTSTTPTTSTTTSTTTTSTSSTTTTSTTPSTATATKGSVDETKAATVLQAQWRGHKIRKEGSLQKLKTGK